MSAFTTSPATLSDLPSVAAVSRAAFKDNPHTISYWILPQDNEEGIYIWRIRNMIDNFNNDPSTHLVKCVDTTNNKIVSFALWQNPQTREAEEEKAKYIAKKKEKGDMDNELPKGTNKPLKDDFDSATQEMRHKLVGEEKIDDKLQVLRAVATLPEYQGQGCASVLLKSGLEIVDARKAKVFLEATPQGRPLYEKFGWKFVDEMIFDLGKYGCSGVQTITCMMREAIE